MHFGFQAVWRRVAAETLAAASKELAAHPGYALVCTGHSLGGALAVLSAVCLQTQFKGTATVRLYTYGQPRTGNQVFAEWANELIDASRNFRGALLVVAREAGG